MKLLILFLAVFGLSTAAVLPSGEVLHRDARSLSDDFADFWALIDTEACVALVIEYLAEDEGFQNLVLYVLSDDFKALVVAVEAIPEYIEFLDYLTDAGLNVYYYVNLIHELLELDPLAVPSTSVRSLISTRITGGVAGFWADCKEILPIAELHALFLEKLETSEEFAAFIALLSSEKAQTIYSALKANEEYQHIRATLIAAGLDVDAIFEIVKILIGCA